MQRAIKTAGKQANAKVGLSVAYEHFKEINFGGMGRYNVKTNLIENMEKFTDFMKDLFSNTFPEKAVLK